MNRPLPSKVITVEIEFDQDHDRGLDEDRLIDALREGVENYWSIASFKGYVT